ncbi:MAG TPA: isochorismatase family cysteine hydrolase [Bryobacteraceae bacterium]|nr:isochorismatase family cysteine hydrolase [Bryobacteraceae bacterium]
MHVVFIDIDTQLDFLYPAGALYVPGAERLVPALANLTRYAAARRIPLVSTVDAHTENDSEFRTWPRHCVAGTIGQHKAEPTLLSGCATVPNREGGAALAGAPQIIVEKQTVDAFQTHTFAGIVQALEPERLVVYGVVTEICVRYAVRGLLRFGRPVTVVRDAIRELTGSACRDAIDEMRAGGAQFVSAAEITA